MTPFVLTFETYEQELTNFAREYFKSRITMENYRELEEAWHAKNHTETKGLPPVFSQLDLTSEAKEEFINILAAKCPLNLDEFIMYKDMVELHCRVWDIHFDGFKNEINFQDLLDEFAQENDLTRKMSGPG